MKTGAFPPPDRLPAWAGDGVLHAVIGACRGSRNKLLGAIEAKQREGEGRTERNGRLLAVAEPSHRYRRCRSIEDIDPDVLNELERFFVFHSAQQGREFKPIGRAGAAEARHLVQAAQRAWAAKGAKQ